MATRQAIRAQLATNVEQYQWTGLLNGDDGNPLELYDYADGSIEFSGTFGVGGTIVWQGGNVAGNYYTLTDAQAAAISKTAAAIEQIAEVCRFVRPIVTAGDGTTSLIATLYVRRGRS
jgi:hypothetical protein